MGTGGRPHGGAPSSEEWTAVRKLMGSLLGTGIFIAGMYGWYAARQRLPAPVALREAAKAGAVYWGLTALLDRLLPRL